MKNCEYCRAGTGRGIRHKDACPLMVAWRKAFEKLNGFAYAKKYNPMLDGEPCITPTREQVLAEIEEATLGLIHGGILGSHVESVGR